ncbi:MAG: ABC transporter substrate-binding protein [Oscillospiraceae bacterium]
MKKYVALLLALVMMLALVACGAPAVKESAAPSVAPSEKPAGPGKELREVTMVLPRTIEVLEDTPYWIANAMGYWEEEGIKVNMEQAFGTTDIKMVATGQADFCAPGPNFLLAAIEEGLPVKSIMAYDAINIWGMCVLKDSKVQTFEDMKGAVEKYGHKLTVALGDASWEMLVTPTLQAAGIDVAKDLEFVVAGENRYIQVSEGKLDMLFSWPGEAWQLMGQGFNFNYIDGNDVLTTSSNCTGMVKGMYGTHYNPEAAAAVSCNQFPNIDVTWKTALFVQQGRAYQMFGKPGSDEEKSLLAEIGTHRPDKWDLNIKAALDAGVIKNTIDKEKIYTNEFVPLDWDRSAVEKDMDAYDVAAAKARYKAE